MLDRISNSKKQNGMVIIPQQNKFEFICAEGRKSQLYLQVRINGTPY